MKKLVSLLLTFALLASLAACRPEEGQPADNATRIRIGVSVYDQYDTFISLLTERFNHYLKEKENTNKYSFTLIFESADGSQVIQNNQVDTFFKLGL